MKPNKKSAQGNKTKYNRQRFAEGSLQRKLEFQEREQSAFDAETERMIRQFSRDKKTPS